MARVPIERQTAGPMASSRTRTPDRPALEPTAILEAALRIVDAEGKDKLTVRRLAQELDVSPMAIYWHFENKAALERRMVEHVVTGASFDDVPREPAEAFLRETFGRMHRGLAEHPGLIPLLQEMAGEAPRGDIAGIIRQLEYMRDHDIAISDRSAALLQGMVQELAGPPGRQE